MRRSVVLLALVACGKSAHQPRAHGDDDAAVAAPATDVRDAGSTASRAATATSDAAATTTATATTAPGAPTSATATPTASWPELADLPPAAPRRIVDLPLAHPGATRASSAGPLIVGALAVVAPSRAGFVAIDLTTAEVMWSRRAGARVARPVARGDRVVLIGDCPPGPPPTLARGDIALGCFDVVD